MKMDLRAIVGAMGARAALGDAAGRVPSGVQTDSREIAAGELFFCIAGERFDGHDFAALALERGACAVVAERDMPHLPEGCVLRVDNVLQALGKLARAHRDASRATVVGITGSVGKTTVKELLAGICSQVGVTAKNHLNLNNQIGLPLSILRATGEEQFWVFEAGINYDGEMDLLGAILAPDVAVLVNVGGVHSQGLGDVRNVARNKARLLRHLQPGGLAVYSADYPELATAVEGYGVRALCFSTGNADVVCTGAYAGPIPGGKGRYTLQVAGERFQVDVPWRGGFMAENLAAAAAAAHGLGIGTAYIRSGLEAARPVARRFQTYATRHFLLVDDCYNANPLSMGPSIAGARELAEERPLILVLGEMRELGAQSAAAHEELGRVVGGSGAKVLFWRGGHVDEIVRGLNHSGFKGNFIAVGSVDAFIEEWRKLAFTRGLVLVKGSRSMKMEHYCDALREELHA